jgi:hypothetical protein
MLDISWESLPEKESDRRGVIYVSGKTTKGTELVKDSIVVIQARTTIELSPSKLHFDKKGGTKTVTITKTNLTDITVSSSSAYVQCAIDGNIITVGIEPNNGPALTTYVYIEGKLPTGAKGTRSLEITQDGTSGEEPELGDNISLKALSFGVRVRNEVTYTNDNPDGQWVGGGPDSDFVGINADEKAFADQRYTATAREDGNILHVVVQGRDLYEERFGRIAWDTKSELEFELEKYKEGNTYNVRILNVKYKEDAAEEDNSESYAITKYGEISFNASSTTVYINKFSRTIEVSNSADFEVSAYKFSWDYKALNHWGDLNEVHYDWGYSDKNKESGSDNFYLKIGFDDDSSWEWLTKE